MVEREALYWGNGFYIIPHKRRNTNAKSAYDYDKDKGPVYAWTYTHIKPALYNGGPRDPNPHEVKHISSCLYDSYVSSCRKVETDKDWFLFWEYIFTGNEPKW